MTLSCVLLERTKEVQLMSENGTAVRVQAAWNAWQSAEVRLDDLRNIHWLQPAGAPRPLLHAYVLSTNVANGNMPRCKGVARRLLVCVLKSHTIPSVYRELSRRAAAPCVPLRAEDAMAMR